MKSKTALFFTLGLFTLYHLITAATLSLSDDGAYYWEWSRHLALSYYDHPPIIAYLIRMSTSLFGSNPLAIRLPNIILLALTSLVIYFLCDYLYHDKKRSLVAVIVFNLFPIVFIGSIIASPDAPSLFCYALGLYLFTRIIYENNAKLWYALAVVVGVGLLSKYTMTLFIFSVFLAILTSKESRQWLLRKEPYWAVLIVLLCFTPVLIWNYQHQWVSFKFQFYGRHHLHVKWIRALVFIALQLLVFSPVFFIGVIIAWINNIKNKEIVLLTCFCAPLFIFILLSLVIDVRIYWPIMSTIPLAIIFVSDSRLLGKTLYWGSFVSLLLCGMITIQEYYPIIKVNPLKKDPTTDYYSWAPVANEVTAFLKSPKIDAKNWFVFDNRFQSAAQIAGSGFFQHNSQIIGKNGILVMNSFWQYAPKDRFKCGKLILYKTVDIVRAGLVFRKGYIYLCYDYRGLR
ncbi:MAG: glycosyltransferase family 39 protein [Gammaproteobacteria bacterium]|nr:glycosyltransferase family 39 protein [Gammaproteobacteria bacterium]